MIGVIAAAGNAKALWYLTRGTGTVALLLLTASVLLGVTTSTRWRSARWPRFLVNGLHRNITLLALAFVVVHVVTTIADGFAPVGVLDTVLPLHSAYRPVWLGLGAVAFDLLLALIVTSLLRARIGFKTWRLVHWLAYASWPVALVHALGTGSDARTLWLQLLAVVSTASVVAAVLWRAVSARSGTFALRGTAVFAAFAVPLAVFIWANNGPLSAGWAARAGTPEKLLASARAPALGTKLTSARADTPSLPRGSFDATFTGRVSESRADNGYVTVTIDARAHGGFAGRVHIAIRGVPLEQGGVQMVDNVLALLPTGAPTWAAGHITALAGTRIAGAVHSSDGRTVHMRLSLTLDQVSDGVTGSLHAGTSPSDETLPT
jgi:sulfoxide reductase heme-binding subunit YedZ